MTDFFTIYDLQISESAPFEALYITTAEEDLPDNCKLPPATATPSLSVPTITLPDLTCHYNIDQPVIAPPYFCSPNVTIGSVSTSGTTGSATVSQSGECDMQINLNFPAPGGGGDKTPTFDCSSGNTTGSSLVGANFSIINLESLSTSVLDFENGCCCSTSHGFDSGGPGWGDCGDLLRVSYNCGESNITLTAGADGSVSNMTIGSPGTSGGVGCQVFGNTFFFKDTDSSRIYGSASSSSLALYLYNPDNSSSPSVLLDRDSSGASVKVDDGNDNYVKMNVDSGPQVYLDDGSNSIDINISSDPIITITDDSNGTTTIDGNSVNLDASSHSGGKVVIDASDAIAGGSTSSMGDHDLYIRELDYCPSDTEDPDKKKILVLCSKPYA